MINIASIYYFTLLQRLTSKYKNEVHDALGKIQKYLKEEGIQYRSRKKREGEYENISLKLIGIGEIYFYQRIKYSRKMYYLPTFFFEIFVEKRQIQTSAKKKKLIFLLSNIFECFDEFEEKNTLIDIHCELETTKYDEKSYFLRHDFTNINSLNDSRIIKNTRRKLQYFAKKIF